LLVESQQDPTFQSVLVLFVFRCVAASQNGVNGDEKKHEDLLRNSMVRDRFSSWNKLPMEGTDPVLDPPLVPIEPKAAIDFFPSVAIPKIRSTGTEAACLLPSCCGTNEWGG
jgi:hypothetical protein